ncbi:MAG TPA: class I SAM-dependent methyltransferase [Candidatus Binatia bacterium]|nr:class I SAM-dependent methyltransferase [Candidatus Binatia bacterium]
MSERDRERWDHKWRQFGAAPDPSPLLMMHRQRLPPTGVALDVACGLGQNSVWLAQHGYRVLGVDISLVALRAAQALARQAGVAKRVALAQVDLDGWRPAPDSVDILCVFRFLDRELVPALLRAVRPQGIAFYLTRNQGILRRRPEASRSYLLAKDELLGFFAGWEIRYHQEGEVNTALVACRQG